jgi:hypothetical protein
MLLEEQNPVNDTSKQGEHLLSNVSKKRYAVRSSGPFGEL